MQWGKKLTLRGKAVYLPTHLKMGILFKSSHNHGMNNESVQGKCLSRNNSRSTMARGRVLNFFQSSCCVVIFWLLGDHPSISVIEGDSPKCIKLFGEHSKLLIQPFRQTHNIHSCHRSMWVELPLGDHSNKGRLSFLGLNGIAALYTRYELGPLTSWQSGHPSNVVEPGSSILPCSLSGAGQQYLVIKCPRDAP